MDMTRDFDIVVFGATGFTGGLACDYLATEGPPALRWAIAGRSPEKLQAVVQRLPEARRPEVIVADVQDQASMVQMTARTKVLLTTVGPYAHFGEPVVAACVETATHYVDITGEPEFVDRMITHYHEAAEAAGVKIVSCCGFDSIPPDLGTFFTVRQLPPEASKKVECFMYGRGTYSGGTWHSAVNAIANRGASVKAKRERVERFPYRGERRIGSAPQRISWRKEIDAWACPLPTIDPDVVKRSARSLPEYGPEFRYAHYVKVRRFKTLVGGAFGLAGLVTLAQFGPTRRWLLGRKAQGDGPTAEEREKGFFRVVFLGQAGDKTVRVEVHGGEPGYSETSKMVSESALCLAFDSEQLPAVSGVLTTAEAMGERLIERLVAAGIGFDVIESSA